MPMRSRFVAVLVAALSLSSVAGASAATKITTAKVTSHAKVTKKSTALAKAKGTGPVVVHPVSTGPVVAAISAFPAGGKGSGTEATCALWSDQLQEDQNAQDEATDKDTIIATTNQLNSDVDNALDAGCAVIY